MRTAPAAVSSRVVLAFALIAGALAFGYGDAMRMPFLNDDYLFLDKVSRTSPWSWCPCRGSAMGWCPVTGAPPSASRRCAR